MRWVVESVGINGRRFRVERVATSNRNAGARLRGETIVISIPSRWPASERERAWKSLLARSVRAIEGGRWRPDAGAKASFRDGQIVRAMGREFEVRFGPAGRFKSSCDGRRISVGVVEGHPDKNEKASFHVRRRIVEAVMPDVIARVAAVNQAHFQASVPRIVVRDNSSRWGSCSRDGSISLSFRLLFMPEGILDYVIVHELAHTRYRSHGPRFWALVERAVPDHREKRKWLRENGWDFPKDEGCGTGAPPESQRKLDEFEYEEPY